MGSRCGRRQISEGLDWLHEVQKLDVDLGSMSDSYPPLCVSTRTVLSGLYNHDPGR